METQLERIEIPATVISSTVCRVGDVGKLVNNAGAAHRWAEEDFLDAAGSADEKKDSSAKNTLKVSLSSQGGSRRTVRFWSSQYKFK